MGLLKLLLFPITAPAKGMVFILEQIRDQAEAQMVSPERIQAALAEIALQHEMGEISADEHQALEDELLAQLNAARRLAAMTPEDQYPDTQIEVSLDEDGDVDR